LWMQHIHDSTRVIRNYSSSDFNHLTDT
jgi:hypothetical protein